ncbi:aminotransferase, class V [Treponema socranskii subsp. socranskii VPI DR56BR1116 = ATCC 35536]|uniref:Aminotransferase, class V n=2 Tax=Treponema socranskii subsp. socranskii VPI DR56BR1116 = ATCC 35536 TaxID=1125725 RepID=U1GTI0_TRESO|nr:aminotransferase class V-fold PLP-dependent enzyme [Treponema socranskii]ERF61240.1 aminotransferase, class V [Treponema socranskii subsp. socranskii VPI DR56BR1116 = ATCC 35536]
MSVNWAKFREEEFPALDKDLTFLDAACVSLIPQRTVRVMHEFIEYSARNDEINSSAHHINMDHKRDKAYTEAAKLLNADLEEIALVESTSHGLNIAATSLEVKPGENILTTNLEFIQVALPWCVKREKEGIEIKVVKAKDNRFTVEDFAKAADNKTRIIVISSVEWCNGWRMDLKSIGDFCKQKGIYLVVDSVQELGVRNMDTKSFHVDILTAGGHKWLNSPFGTGVMYINKDLLGKIDPVFWGYLNSEAPAEGWGAYWENPGSQAVNNWKFVKTARRFEIGGTSNYPGAIALGESLGLVNELGIKNIEEHVLDLGDYCMKKMEELGGTIITHKERDRRAGIVIFRLYNDTKKDLEILKKLHAKRVLIAQRFTDYVGGFRVSCQYYNMEKDIDVLADTLKPIIAEMGKPDYKKV